jgi:Spy/CpxP family protein refolding chaperone
MKRFTAALSIVLSALLLTALPAEAQHRHHRGQQQPPNARGMMGPGMMQGGMMPRMHQQMMQNPMHRAHMMMFMLPAFADTLGLSEEQTAQINELKSQAMSQHKAHRQQMMTHRQELMGLFDSDAQPSTDAIREHVMAMAEMRANQQVARYETGQQMREVLTDEQRQMLDDMAPQQMMHQMMSNMTMMDMMQMMRSMHGGQTGGDMMQGGMMMRRMQNMPVIQHRPNR